MTDNQSRPGSRPLLTGKVALVEGASRGIGVATAQALYRPGKPMLGTTDSRDGQAGAAS